jgi:hypothetical protein
MWHVSTCENGENTVLLSLGIYVAMKWSLEVTNFRTCSKTGFFVTGAEPSVPAVNWGYTVTPFCAMCSKMYFSVSDFRHFRIVAKSACSLRHVRPSLRVHDADPTGRISVKFDYGDYDENLSRSSRFC